jgi:hypothetical protein
MLNALALVVETFARYAIQCFKLAHLLQELPQRSIVSE